MAGVGVEEVEQATEVINATRIVCNFQKPAWNVRKLSGNFSLVA